MMTRHSILPMTVVLALGMAASAASAGETSSIFQTNAVQADASVDTPGTSSPISALSDDALLAQTGMGASALENAIISTNTLTNTAGEVNAGDLFAGDISFSDNALQNTTGMSSFVVNTGHGASVQGAMNVNIILK